MRTNSEMCALPNLSRRIIPKVVLFFIEEIEKRLAAKGFNKKVDDNCVAIISSTEILYNWDAIKVVQKHYSKDGWECKMTHFYKTEDKKYNIYTWTFNRKKEKNKNIWL